MNNERKIFGENLKKARKKCFLSVGDVTEIMRDRYSITVAEKTVYGWESGQAAPTSIMLAYLCDIYDIKKVEELFGGIIKTNKTKEAEKLDKKNYIFSKYNSCPELKTIINRILGLDEYAIES